MAYQHYRSPFGDTTYTKVFVGGLAWETPTDVMRRYFEQFGDILEAVIITDKNTGKSKGYGFVTFRDPESARRACVDANPMIDGRRANCNIASLGRPRPTAQRGRTQGGNPFHGGGVTARGASSSYSGVPTPTLLPPPPPPAYVYSPYGYTTYPPEYSYHQTIYSPQMQQAPYFHQLYGGSSSGMGGGSPYFYGYSMQAAVSRGAAFSATPSVTAAQRIPAAGPTSYLYYTPPPSHGHRQMEASFPAASTYPPPHPLPLLQLPPTATATTTIRLPFASSTDSSNPRPASTTSDTETGIVTSENPDA